MKILSVIFVLLAFYILFENILYTPLCLFMLFLTRCFFNSFFSFSFCAFFLTKMTNVVPFFDTLPFLTEITVKKRHSGCIDYIIDSKNAKVSLIQMSFLFWTLKFSINSPGVTIFSVFLPRKFSHDCIKACAQTKWQNKIQLL